MHGCPYEDSSSIVPSNGDGESYSAAEKYERVWAVVCEPREGGVPTNEDWSFSLQRCRRAPHDLNWEARSECCHG